MSLTAWYTDKRLHIRPTAAAEPTRTDNHIPLAPSYSNKNKNAISELVNEKIKR